MDEFSKILIILLIIVALILLVLFCALIFLVIKTKLDRKKDNDEKPSNEKKIKSTIEQKYNLQSIIDFMEFDKIEDNMIIEDNGNKYLMVVKCQGINYDLMSEAEKVSVEQGFIQYLNTLRYQIQIYVQTTKVDLKNSLVAYKDKVKKISNELVQKELIYNQHVKDGVYSGKNLTSEYREVIKMRNLYEYSLDIINNIERMSLNRNILSKQYYIIIPYYSDEIGAGAYDKDEIQNMAFSELYVRAQSTINLLSVCGVVGKIMDSTELSKLLYTAYNRDEAEIFDLGKAIEARYDEMYTTGPDILDKKMKILNKRVEEEAIKRANEAVFKVKQENQKEKMLKKKEEEFEASVMKLAKALITNNAGNIGITTAEKAKKEIDNTNNNAKDNSKKEDRSNEKEKTRRVRRKQSE